MTKLTDYAVFQTRFIRWIISEGSQPYKIYFYFLKRNALIMILV